MRRFATVRTVDLKERILISVRVGDSIFTTSPKLLTPCMSAESDLAIAIFRGSELRVCDTAGIQRMMMFVWTGVALPRACRHPLRRRFRH